MKSNELEEYVMNVVNHILFPIQYVQREKCGNIITDLIGLNGNYRRINW